MMCAVRRAALLLLIPLLAACTKTDDVAEGQRLYMAYGCAACHGANGDGSGPAAGLSHFKPRDLRDPATFSGPRGVAGIATTIAFGIADGRTGMPGYPDIPKKEREQMARWILSLAGQVKISNVWIREPAMQQVASGYLSLANPTTRPVALIGVSSPDAAFVEMHDTSTKDGMMSMRKVERIAVPTRGAANLQPGGLHLMLINLKRQLRSGDDVTLTLTFDDGTTSTTTAKVRGE